MQPQIYFLPGTWVWSFVKVESNLGGLTIEII